MADGPVDADPAPPDSDPGPAPVPARAWRNNRRSAPPEVWERVKADYLAGVPGAVCCLRHGVGLTTLPTRAAVEGWRLADQPWAPPSREPPWDEGDELEADVGGDLEKLDYGELAWVADRRMVRAVLHGEAAAALRWRRVRDAMQAEQAALDRIMEEEAACERARAAGAVRDSRDSRDTPSPGPEPAPGARP